jgi:hypothetical protein
MSDSRDVTIIRDLARRYAEIAAKPIQDERRDLWRRHNSLQRTRPLIYMRWLAAWDLAEESRLRCEDPFWRGHEDFLRQMIFQDTLGDDYVIEPWITQGAVHVTPPGGLWGLPYSHIPSTEPGGAWKYDPPMKDLADIEKLSEPHHVIDEEATARLVARVQETVGDILPVAASRAPAYSVWRADISYDLAQLRGLEQVMWDMEDNPQWLRRLVGHLSRGILRTHQEAERAGDWRLCDHQNQAMPYALELPDPCADPRSVRRKDLWCFTAAQEMAQVGPAHHEEFILRYQMPIMREFGLVAYGCCEDLTRKIGILRQVPNLRRIAVTPWADVARCAEQIGTDYVFSWRPSPANMICLQFDPTYIRRTVREAMEACKGCHVDITLKDVQALAAGTESLAEWVRIVREVSDQYA